MDPGRPRGQYQLIKENCKNPYSMRDKDTIIKYELSHYAGYRPIGQAGRYFCIWMVALRVNLARSGKGGIKLSLWV